MRVLLIQQYYPKKEKTNKINTKNIKEIQWKNK